MLAITPSSTASLMMSGNFARDLSLGSMIESQMSAGVRDAVLSGVLIDTPLPDMGEVSECVKNLAAKLKLPLHLSGPEGYIVRETGGGGFRDVFLHRVRDRFHQHHVSLVAAPDQRLYFHWGAPLLEREPAHSLDVGSWKAAKPAGSRNPSPLLDKPRPEAQSLEVTPSVEHLLQLLRDKHCLLPRMSLGQLYHREHDASPSLLGGYALGHLTCGGAPLAESLSYFFGEIFPRREDAPPSVLKSFQIFFDLASASGRRMYRSDFQGLYSDPVCLPRPHPAARRFAAGQVDGDTRETAVSPMKEIKKASNDFCASLEDAILNGIFLGVG